MAVKTYQFGFLAIDEEAFLLPFDIAEAKKPRVNMFAIGGLKGIELWVIDIPWDDSFDFEIGFKAFGNLLFAIKKFENGIGFRWPSSISYL